MKQIIASWRGVSAMFSQHLRWKLAFSHLTVVLIAQLINLIGFGLIVVVAGQVEVPFNSRESGRILTYPIDSDGSALLALVIFWGGLFLLVTMFASGVAATLGVLLARRFGHRLQALVLATESIIRGDLSARVAVTDLDEIGQIAVRFNLLTQRLDDVDRARRSFVSNISHELRTPLAVIRGHVEAQLASDSKSISPEVLKIVEREVHALGSLIDDLFTLTRIEEASLPIQAQPVALQQIAASAISGIRPLASQQGHIAVQSLIPADFPPALVDPIRLTQILNNLLYNALRHTPDGGIIVVEGRVLSDAMIELAVTDTGVGIAPDDLPHIFDRYFYGQNGHNVGGSGLGLAIVKQLVEAQGGTVHAQSVKGQGTTIRFSLPRV